jgi:predicted DCC family thiol-disulfide oxidoreductase YuxK
MSLRSGQKVVLFDGVCNFCTGWVNFLIRWDRSDNLRFARLQAPVGADIFQKHFPEKSSSEASKLESVVFIENNRGYAKSDAVIRIACQMPFPFPLAGIFYIVPRFVRDSAYDYVGRNRYDWWGKNESCMVPTDERVKRKFLD